MQTNVKSSVLVNILRTVTMTILSFVTFPYVARVLGDAGLGMYNWAVAFVYYFLVIARISIPNIAVREIVKVKDDPDQMNQKVHEFFVIQLITTAISFGLMCAFFFAIPAFRIENATPIVFILSLNFLVGVFSFEWLYTALEKHKYMAIRSMIIAVIVDVLIFVFITSPDNIVLYTFFCVLTTILTVGSNLILLPKVFKFKKPHKLYLKQYLPVIGIMAAISVVLAVYDKTDSFILGLIDESKASVGDYTVGMKCVEIVIGVITALSTVFIPRATDIYNKGTKEEFKNINVYSSNIALFIVIPSIAFMVTLSGPITNVLSGWDGNTTIGTILIVLASLMLTYSVSNIIYTQILIPTKKEKLYLFTMLGGAILNIGLSCLFALVTFKDNPTFGVALGTAITDALVLITLFILTWGYSKHILLNVNNLKVLGLGIVVAGISILLNKYLVFSLDNIQLAELLKIVIVFVIDVVIYFVGAYLLKEKTMKSLFKKE